jgi:hypothetical protein
MVRQTIKIGILGVMALIGIAIAIPTSLTSLILTGVAIIGIVAVLIKSL